ncbi:uncharacterized protein LOC117788480 [Drosophila innubila]|uniref:uncharacterized protein LOC117788480 n=1 Tax=Drosophila innubila TaxID=198719 RepID=UPI00148DAAE9|nr:uncharacterized protein LOC117788480 [Drosophila innubila]
MQPRRQAPVTLTTLNDDCLLLICGQIPIRDQFMLLQLGGRLRQLVLHVWRRKYADEFDWQLAPQLKFLNANEQCQLLGHMARMTRALLNLDASEEALLTWLTEEAKWQRLTDMQRISFTKCNSRLLQQLSGVCHSIVHLQLGACQDVTPADLVTLFGQLTHLRVFELLPGGRNSGCICNRDVSVLAKIEYCQTLHSLKLPSCALRAAAVQIARLPQLRQLTGFLCCSRDMDDDKGKEANAGAVATATISACLTALIACQIVALNLQCQLDGSLLRMLQGHVGVLQLHRFAWHSQLMVHYDATDGSIKWLPQQPQVARDILHFIVSQAASLHELDFTRNVHATPTFLAQLDEYFLFSGSGKLGQASQVAVWHDGCPRPRVSKENQHTNVNSNDLAFVDFELKHLANEKTQ